MNRHASFYRRLLRVYPATLREEYAEEMSGVFEDLLSDAQESGRRFPALRTWRFVIVDLVASASRERMEDAMNNHPIPTRMLLIGVPVASLAGMAFFGSVIGIPVLAAGLVLLMLGWRAVSASMYGPSPRPWWLTPLLGIALFGVGIVFTQLPGPGDLMWGLATLLGLIGLLTALVSVAVSLFAWSRRPAAPSASR